MEPNVSSTELTLLYFNDIYEMDPVAGNGGLGELMTLMERERASHRNCITTMNGDFMVVSSIAYLVWGAHVIDIFNHMKVDMVVAGNHEFDFGPEKLHDRIKESKFKWLTTNVRERETPTSEWRPLANTYQTYIREVDGFKVGFFGITTHECTFLSHPGDDIDFLPFVQCSKEAVASLKEQGAEVIVALTHQSYNEDLELAKQVPAIDVILGGHDHHAVTTIESTTLISKAGQNAHYLGVVTLHLERNPINGSVILHHSWKMVLNRNTPRNPVVGGRINYYTDQLYSLREKPLGVTKTLLVSKTEKVRQSETTMGNLFADAMRDFFSADVAVVQSGAVRGDFIYPPGTVLTQFDLLRESPFNNFASLVSIKGSDLRETLEQALRKLPARAGCYPQVSGLRIRLDPSRDPGKRILDIQVEGKDGTWGPLDDTKHYTCATTEFLRNGGDGLEGFLKSNVLKANAKLMRAVLYDYISSKGEVSPTVEGRTLVV